MARIRQHMHYSDTRAELAEYKDARRGATEDAFWDEDELIDYRSSPSKKKKPRKRRGCPENDYKAHVYIWQHVVKTYIGWNGKWRTWEYDEYICCGCSKVHNRRYKW